MFYLIGTGISSYKDISINGVDICKKCDIVYIERYTSIISDNDLQQLEKLISKKIIELDRNKLETDFESIIFDKKKNVALLVVGDPLTATTHIEFLHSCKEKNIEFKVIHASSIFSSVCETGLHAYRFGKSCSIPYPEKNYNPTSYFDIIVNNYKNNAHTIVFLDIKKAQEKYMTITEGLNILLNISKQKNSFFNKSTMVIGIARLGKDDQIIKYGKVESLLNFEFGASPHILIVPKMTRIEKEYVEAIY